MSALIAWAAQRAGTAAMVVSIAIALWSFAWWQGYRSAESRCREQAMIAQLQEKERQRRAGETALRQLQELLDEQGRELARLDAEAEAYVAQLEAAGGADECRLTDDDVRRLQSIH